MTLRLVHFSLSLFCISINSQSTQKKITIAAMHLFFNKPKKYNFEKLVYYEVFDPIASEIVREKRLKAWKREWKITLIEDQNPGWEDLWKEIV